MVRAWASRLAGLLFGAAVVRAVVGDGDLETRALYAAALLALPAVLVLLPAVPGGLASRPQLIALFLSGTVLTAAVALEPTLEARGYLHAALGWAALLLSLCLACKGRSWQRALIVFLLAVGGLEAVSGLYQVLGGGAEPGATGPTDLALGTYLNRNHFAGLLGMTLPLGLGVLYAVVARRRSDSLTETQAMVWLVLLSASLMGVAVLFSQSRGGTLVLAAALTFQACLLAVRGRRDSTGSVLSARVVSFLLVLIVTAGLAIGLRPLLDRFAKLEDGAARLTVYRDTLALVRDHPFGVGPGMYGWRFRPYQSQSPEVWFDHAHNDYLEAAAEWGVLGAAVLWGLVFWRVRGAIRVFLGPGSSWSRGIALGAAGSMVAILVHSVVDFNLQVPANLMVFSTIVGLAWSVELARRLDAAGPGTGAS